MSEHWRLLADIGGTNIRFGLTRPVQPADAAREITNLQSWPCDGFRDFDVALRAYLDDLEATDMRFASAAIAAAGPSAPDSISLTNRDWTITADGLRRALGPNIETHLLNDLEAVAYALPFLPSDAIDWSDDRRPPLPLAGRRLALNVGTGFGSAAILATGDGWTCCPAESGHMHLGIANMQERALLTAFSGDVVMVEDVLSGDGASRLWQAVSATAVQAIGSTPVDISFDFAATGPSMAETRAIFSTFLARTAGNLVLASAAWDGVYLCGSVATAWAKHADRDAFRRTFAGTSKMQKRLADAPIGLIRHPFPALVGLANLRMA